MSSTKGQLRKSDVSAEMQFEFAKEQLNSAIETFREQLNLTVQIFATLITADVALVGFAISQKIAGILLLGAILPLAIMMVSRAIARRMKPILLCAVGLEAKYGEDSDNWLASTFISSVLSPEYLKRLQDISKLPDRHEQIAQLRKMPSPLTTRKTADLLVSFIGVGQIVTSVILVSQFNWQFF